MRVLNRQEKFSNNRVKTSIAKRPLLWRRLNLSLISLCVLGSFLYLSQINNLVVKSFEIRDLKIESRLGEEMYQDWQAKLLELQSYNSLISRLDSSNMVAIDDITYYNSSSSLVLNR